MTTTNGARRDTATPARSWQDAPTVEMHLNIDRYAAHHHPHPTTVGAVNDDAARAAGTDHMTDDAPPAVVGDRLAMAGWDWLPVPVGPTGPITSSPVATDGGDNIDTTDPVEEAAVDSWWTRARSHRLTPMALIATGVVAVVAIGAVVIAGIAHTMSGSDSAPVAIAPAPPPVAAWCPDTTSPTGQIQTAGPGSQADGPSVIAAFDYAFYTRHDAAAARALIDPAQPQPSQDSLASVITQTLTAAGTTPVTHCVRITPATNPGKLPAGVSAWDVDLTVRSVSTTSFPQRITTRTLGGATVIATLETTQGARP